MGSAPTAEAFGPPARLHHAVFQSIGEEGRAALVERRIADAIMAGVLRAGERLPAETDLASSFGVAPATTREALLALRERGLIVTRRGRSGGSFVAEGIDPNRFAALTLVDSSRLAIRDLAQHYSAVTLACVTLAVRRADTSEISRIRARLDRVDDHDLGAWRRAHDDAIIELAAQSQSARLTREQVQLQGEWSPWLALVDTDPEARGVVGDALITAIAAVAEGHATTAIEAIAHGVHSSVDWLIAYRDDLISTSAAAHPRGAGADAVTGER